MSDIARTLGVFLQGIDEEIWVKRGLIGVTWIFLSVFLILPVILVFRYAFSLGLAAYLQSFLTRDARSALALSVFTALIVVPVNAVFGIIMAWAIAKFEFRGKNILLTLLDVPFAVSPVIAGMMLLLLFGSRGLLGPWLQETGIRIVFARPGIVLATLFVTLPFVARELIPLMHAQGTEAEISSLTLGATGFQTFFRVTLPGIKWGLLYGVLLSNARSFGEFGAVSVVSGHIRGQTNTIPLHVEILFNDYQFAASFAMASLLVFLGLLTLFVKGFAESKENYREH
ncbi:sulfate transport system permease protein [Alkalispirochaeta americana]|uniref:Sulfate transport system permease protein n=1 Tax=Alkalispirochaeta americana TaxID=159291 RepID=A0A1N6T0A0_9SPIO|nr:sulfate ABC transporter permease subunit CysW [Alkalispirochaeta americana]SIQ46657.1 sulfate transport system permease protein [Alkalispirochaeta americana]